MDWARWWLDRGDADTAAEWLRPGDEVRSNEAQFAALAAAVARHGLRALHNDGVAYVYSPEEAAQLQEMADRLAGEAPGMTAGDRLPPSRATPGPTRKRKTA